MPTPKAHKSHTPEWVADIVDGLPPLSTIKETADVLRLSPRTLVRRINAGYLRTVHEGKQGMPVRIPRLEIARYLERHAK